MPVAHSRYASPIVTIVKTNGTIRICGDYKLTVNPSIDTEQYPIPRVEEIFSNLADGKLFSRLDMRDAYNQLELDEESRQLVTINTSLVSLYTVAI